jgi:hypothetical protein
MLSSRHLCRLLRATVICRPSSSRCLYVCFSRRPRRLWRPLRVATCPTLGSCTSTTTTMATPRCWTTTHLRFPSLPPFWWGLATYLRVVPDVHRRFQGRCYSHGVADRNSLLSLVLPCCCDFPTGEVRRGEPGVRAGALVACQDPLPAPAPAAVAGHLQHGTVCVGAPPPPSHPLYTGDSSAKWLLLSSAFYLPLETWPEPVPAAYRVEWGVGVGCSGWGVGVWDG